MLVILWITGSVFGSCRGTPPKVRTRSGSITETTRDTYPDVAWSQIVCNNETVAGNDAQGRFKLMRAPSWLRALAGLATGSPENMVFYGADRGLVGSSWACVAREIRHAGSNTRIMPRMSKPRRSAGKNSRR